MTTNNAVNTSALGGMATQSPNSIAVTGGSIITTAISRNPINETTTARTLSVTDVGADIRCSNVSGDTTITIPTNATVAIPIGAQIELINDSGVGNGRLLIVSLAGGVTLNPFTPTVGYGGVIRLEKINTNEWKVLSCYESGTHTTNWTGIWASNQAGNISYVRNMLSVSLTIPQVLSTQNNTSALVTNVTALPARLRPTQLSYGICLSYTASNNVVTVYQVNTSGTVTIYGSSPPGNYPANTGLGGFNELQTSAYLIS